jgi:hypothetical protein
MVVLHVVLEEGIGKLQSLPLVVGAAVPPARAGACVTSIHTTPLRQQLTRTIPSIPLKCP